MKKLSLLFSICLMSVYAAAQDLHILPTMSPAGGSFQNEVIVRCTWPEGCAGGVYYTQGGEIMARPCTDSVVLNRSVRLSIAGVNQEGRIITDAVSYDFDITQTKAPTIECTPSEGIRESSFYVTQITWHNIVQTDLDVSDFKAGGSREGQPAVWLCDSEGHVLTTGTFSNVWQAGLNSYKIYLYKNYKQPVGHYTLHIAGGLFVLDNEPYEEELVLHYEIAEQAPHPVFSPASGDYVSPLTVRIDYPTDGSAFYPFYSINEGDMQLYEGPITLTESATVTAFGYDELMLNQTEQVSATYTLHAPAPKPEPLPAPVVDRTASSLTLSCETPGAVIKYWTNDRMQNAVLYNGPIALTTNMKISCVAYTADRSSETVDYYVTNFPKEESETGVRVVMTPEEMTEIHLMSMSENGRFAVGYVGQNLSMHGFIWDISSGAITYPNRAYIGQLWYVSNDGVAYGWRARSVNIDEQTGDEELLWGTVSQGEWTEQPAGMEVQSLTADGLLRGWLHGQAVFFDPATGATTPDELLNRIGRVSALSSNEEWAIIGNSQRLHIPSGRVENIISTHYLYPNEPRPEQLASIADDGTIFGTYWASFAPSQVDEAIVYTPDQTWRWLRDWLRDQCGQIPDLQSYRLTALRTASGDKQQFLLQAFPLQLTDDGFTRGVSLMLDAPLRHLAPVAVEARQILGSEAIRISWQPRTNPNDILDSYTLLRDGQVLATLPNSATEFIDETVAGGQDYCYSLIANYADGVSSAESYSSCCTCIIVSHQPVEALRSRRVGLNSLMLSWQAPVHAIPRLQYFDDVAESYAFGVAGFDSEWGIRIPATDLAPFYGDSIRTFQVLPTGRQLNYELRLYTGSTTGGYNTTPFYTQTIDPDQLQYNAVNTILLTTPQAVPENVDLYVGFYVQSAGDYDILGIQYDGFRRGYSDLCRVVGVHNQFISIAEESSETTEIVLPLGIGICSRAQLLADIVDYYTLTEDDSEPVLTPNLCYLMEDVVDGEHTYRVSAVYADGTASQARSLDQTMVLNEQAYLPVETVAVDCDENLCAYLSWQTPRDEDRLSLHYGDTLPTPGLDMQEHFTFMAAASVYPATLTRDYANLYEIYGLYFCPTAEADFVLSIDNANSTEESFFYTSTPQNLTYNQINYITLPEPIRINAAIAYRLTVSVFNCQTGLSPLAFDSSNHCEDGFSNLLTYDYGETTLSQIMQIDEHPNWLMGLLIRRIDSPELPAETFRVILDDELLVETADNEVSTTPLTKGEHTVQVDTRYPDDFVVEGMPCTFRAGDQTALENHHLTLDGMTYDILGRIVRIPLRGGIYIQSGQKILQQ